MSAVSILLVFFMAACAVLLAAYIQCLRQIRSITQTLLEFQSGCESGPVFIRTRSMALKRLAEQLNLLAERVRTLTERMEHLEAVQKRIMTHIAHDLRTPLTSLSGYAEMLKNDRAWDEAAAKKYIDIIFAKSQRLSELVRNFFEWAKLEADDAPLNFQRVELTAKLQEIVVNFVQEFEKKETVPILELPRHRVFVWADVSGLERILNNLISNSIQHGHDGKTHGIKVWEEKDKERVWIEVWDRGRGVDPSDIPFIFERLYKGGGPSLEASRGSGLGLSITKKLVEKHGGEIVVRSTPFEQTAFSFYLKTAEP
ncbi:sensor histidine kinase [Paenibacillus tyrfis]|uniref:sensor histidine kinase n=1 Tax=Paenibacillus tyrfis TaxID=1501230 RepID=UPI00068DB411|nr:HAMP domain-containing sensor histidine kinase [Paenibacillus tyrfis]